jgi:hypothetical protein
MDSAIKQTAIKSSSSLRASELEKTRANSFSSPPLTKKKSSTEPVNTEAQEEQLKKEALKEAGYIFTNEIEDKDPTTFEYEKKYYRKKKKGPDEINITKGKLEYDPVEIIRDSKGNVTQINYNAPYQTQYEKKKSDDRRTITKDYDIYTYKKVIINPDGTQKVENYDTKRTYKLKQGSKKQREKYEAYKSNSFTINPEQLKKTSQKYNAPDYEFKGVLTSEQKAQREKQENKRIVELIKDTGNQDNLTLAEVKQAEQQVTNRYGKTTTYNPVLTQLENKAQGKYISFTDTFTDQEREANKQKGLDKFEQNLLTKAGITQKDFFTELNPENQRRALNKLKSPEFASSQLSKEINRKAQKRFIETQGKINLNKEITNLRLDSTRPFGSKYNTIDSQYKELVADSTRRKEEKANDNLLQEAGKFAINRANNNMDFISGRRIDQSLFEKTSIKIAGELTKSTGDLVSIAGKGIKAVKENPKGIAKGIGTGILKGGQAFEKGVETSAGFVMYKGGQYLFNPKETFKQDKQAVQQFRQAGQVVGIALGTKLVSSWQKDPSDIISKSGSFVVESVVLGSLFKVGGKAVNKFSKSQASWFARQQKTFSSAIQKSQVDDLIKSNTDDAFKYKNLIYETGNKGQQRNLFGQPLTDKEVSKLTFEIRKNTIVDSKSIYDDSGNLIRTGKIEYNTLKRPTSTFDDLIDGVKARPVTKPTNNLGYYVEKPIFEVKRVEVSKQFTLDQFGFKNPTKAKGAPNNDYWQKLTLKYLDDPKATPKPKPNNLISPQKSKPNKAVLEQETKPITKTDILTSTTTRSVIQYPDETISQAVASTTSKPTPINFNNKAIYSGSGLVSLSKPQTNNINTNNTFGLDSKPSFTNTQNTPSISNSIKIETNNKSKSSFTTAGKIDFSSKQDTNTNSSLFNSTKPITESIEVSKPATDLISNTDTSIDVGTKTDVSFKTDTQLKQRQALKNNQLLDNRLNLRSQGNRISEAIKQPQKKPPRIPRLSFGQSNKRASAFDVFVKQKNKFVQVNKNPLTKDSALFKGASIVDNTALRTFKIAPSKSNKAPEKISSAFFDEKRFYRKKSGVFVEKTTFAIDTFGEKEEITEKGIFANKNKIRFNNKRGRKNVF